MVTLPKTFISVTGSDIVMASSENRGDWSVETLLSGKKATCLAIDPQNKNTLFCGTQKQGIWRSDDSGHTWMASGLENQSVKSISVNLHDPEIMYAGTKRARCSNLLTGAKAGTN
jgi:hypothetical protein